MQSKKQEETKSGISPVLFMSVDGEPMYFFLRPGPAKCKLQPLITAGGGVVCNVQQPGAILLIDPEERASIPESTAHWYVSAQYIHDCIEKDVQLELEDYKLNPEKAESRSAKRGDIKESNPNFLGGRVLYTAEEDAAILSYVSKHKARAGGIQLWQEMEEKRVTSRSWQSMKARYTKHLHGKQSRVQEVAAAEQDTKVDANQDKATENPSSENDVSQQTCSADTDLTQIDVQPSPAESAQPENVPEVASTSAQPKGRELDPQTDVHPAPPENAQIETTEPQEAVGPEPEPQSEEPPKGQVESPSDSNSEKKSDVIQKASPKVDQPRRRSVRRKLDLNKEPSPPFYGRKLRSFSNPRQQPAKRTQTPAKPPPNATGAEPPSKRNRVSSERPENGVKESPRGSSSTAAPGGSSNLSKNDSPPQNGEKTKPKRQLGILELAAKEFDCSSCESEDEDMDVLSPDVKEQKRSTPIKPGSTSEPTADAASSLSESDEGTKLQENAAKPQTSTGNHPSETGGPGPSGADPVQPKPHLFIFDSESQEEGSQSNDGDDTSAMSQPEVDEHAAFSLTQSQLEEDKERIRELMSQTNHDLVCVTWALMRASGDICGARFMLSNPSRALGPRWSRHDDSLLRSSDPEARQQLVEKYGEEEVAKRIVFLEVER